MSGLSTIIPGFGGPASCLTPLVEAVAAYFPPMYLSTIRGGVSPTTGKHIEGYLYTLAAYPASDDEVMTSTLPIRS